MISSLYRPRNLKRYRHIATVFARHGFGSVLEYLQVHRQISIPKRLLSQDSSARISPAEHLRLALEELGPTFIKLGQILSTRPDLLPVEFITQLCKLQDDVPPFHWEAVYASLIKELDEDPEKIFAYIDPKPLASASLAQVHAATLKDGSQVVLKVQRPDILSTIESDLEIMHDLAILAKKTPVGQIVNPVEIVDDFAFILFNELDYLREGRNADRFRENFAHETHLYIPKVYWEYCSHRLLVMERIQGIKIDDIDALEAAGYDRHQVALNSARIIIKEILEDGFFHGDPHPGNFVVMPEEVIGAMDFGIVGYLRERDRKNLIRLYLTAITLNTEEIVEQLIRIGAANADVDRVGLARDLDRILKKYHSLPLHEIRAGDVIEEIMPIALQYHLTLSSDLWLLCKTASMMEGVGLKLDPKFDIFAVGEQYVKKLVWQLVLPERTWGQSLIRQSADWSEFIQSLPRTGSRLMEQLESGSLFHIGFKDTDRIINGLDRLTTRLALSLLAAALIIALAMLIPITTPGSIIQWVVVIGFIGAVGLGVWLLISMRKIIRN